MLRGDGVELRFTARPPVPDAELAGTAWVLDTLLEGEVASSTVAEATLRIGDDGTTAGGTGCNELSAMAEVVDGRLQVAELTTTRIGCEDAVAAQERHVLDVLQGSPALTLEGPRMTLLLDDGRGLVYRAA